MQYTEYRNRVTNSDLSFLILVKCFLYSKRFYFISYFINAMNSKTSEKWNPSFTVKQTGNISVYIRRMSKCHCCFHHLLPVMKITKFVELWKSEELNLEWDIYEILSSSSNSHRKEYYKGIAARRFIFCWEAQNTK